MRTLRNNILVLIVICVLCVNPGYAERGEPRTYVLATGSESGVYYALGLGIQAAVTEVDPNIRIEVLSTSGAVENLALLDKGQDDFAFTQNNIAHWFYHGQKLWALPSRKIAGVASLYTESIQIIASKDSYVSEVRDLRGKTVCTKPDETSKFSLATDILGAVGIERSQITETTHSLVGACEAVEDPNDPTEAAFIVGGVPTPAIADVCEGGQIGLIDFPKRLASLSRRSCPYLVYHSISPNTYPGQTEEVMTLGVRALLVARRDLAPEVVHTVAKAIFEQTEELERKHVQGNNIELHSATKGMTIYLHPGAKQYLRLPLPVRLRRYLMTIFNYILGVSLALFLVSYLVHGRFLPGAIGRSEYVRPVMVLFCVYTLGAILMVLYEGPVNENFRNLAQSFWSILVYLSSGLEDRPPVTRGGTVAAQLLFFVLGAGFGGLVTRKLTAALLRKEKRMTPRLKKACGDM
ncbi:MAG: TAXI family TRAP transporter solute-binding subunit [Planctomycetota bacterium]|jgi:TRAP transporter TAXI family solute receptor